ncbi:hypothetical protein [Micromonospora sp. WMMD1155]|uniref:hypothetical protein n=1 Tax=Micromonospora sp. WMMD1155 TaxID=3016094 RepID=UPI00249A2A85|nr:hypothetical protein [Micromonospora sp. WMMD1155]WFE52519.1 hypothetical protein O7617_20325 [Micromonospora sp. WMMD1155]
MQLPLWSLLTTGSAVLLAVHAARWARHTALGGPLRIALGVVLPIGAVMALAGYTLDPDDMPGSGPVIEATAGDSVDRISAPLWLFSCLTDWNFGLPRPTRWKIFLIADEVLVEPMFYLACSPYALAYTIRAARSAPAEQVALAATPV